MAVLTGGSDSFYLEFNSVALTSDYREFDDGMEEDTVDGSAGGDDVRVMVQTLIKVDPSLTIIVDDNAEGQAIRAVLKIGQTGNLIWGPEGNAPGKPKWGISARCTAAPTKRTYDKEAEIEVKFANLQGTFVFDGRTATF